MCYKRVLKEIENIVDCTEVAHGYNLDCKHNYCTLEDFYLKGHSNNRVV
jgi:hypothetical protein